MPEVVPIEITPKEIEEEELILKERNETQIALIRNSDLRADQWIFAYGELFAELIEKPEIRRLIREDKDRAVIKIQEILNSMLVKH